MGDDNHKPRLRLVFNGIPDQVFPHSAQALCQDMDPDIFFPKGPGRLSYERGRKICNRCPVRVECLEWELQWETPWNARSGMGMFGGKTPRERAAILLERRKGTT